MSEQVNSFGRANEVQGNWNMRGNFDGPSWNKRGRSSIQPKSFASQPSQTYPHYSKTLFVKILLMIKLKKLLMIFLGT